MDAFDPYYEWLGIPPKDQPPNAYRLLGLELFESNPKVIETAAEQRMLLLRTRQSGKHSHESQRLLNEISQAQRMLLDPAKRTAYDDQLRTQFAAPVELLPHLPPENVYANIPLSTTSPTVPTAETVVAPVAIRSSGAPVRRRGTPWVLLSVAGGVGLLLITGVVLLITTMAKQEPDSNPHRAVVERPKEIIKKDRLPPATGGTAEQVAKNVPKTEPAGPSSTDVPPTPATQTIPADTEPPPKIDANTVPLLVEPAAPEIPTRQPLPADAETKAALARLREALADQFKAFNDGSDPTTLLKRLEQMADESIDRPAEHVAILMETRRLAMEVGDWWTAVRVVDRLDQRFEVERYELLAESYAQSAKAKLGRREKLLLFRRLIEFAEDLIDAHMLTPAAKLLKDVEKPLKALDDPLVSEAADELRARGAELYPHYKLAQESLAEVREESNNPEANRLAGEYLCLACGKWADGLPLLSRGNDEALRKLAERDLASPMQPGDQFALASAWWEYSESLEPLSKHNVQLRAAQWYRAALAGLQGDDLKLAEKRVDDLLPEGLVALSSPLEESPSAMPETLYLDDVADDFAAVVGGVVGRHGASGMRGDIPFPEWTWQGKRAEHALFFHPPTNGTSFLLFRLGGAYGRFRGTVGIVEAAGAHPPASSATFRILGDGRLLWESKPTQERGGVGESFDVDISQVDTLRLEISASGLWDNVHTAWIQPQLYRPVKPLKTYARRALRTGNEVYLDDLVEAESSVGYARLTRMGSTTGAAHHALAYVGEHERRALRSIMMVPHHNGSAYAVYPVDRGFREFRARVGVTPEFKEDKELSPLTFSVIGDGKVLWKSNKITRANHFESCSANIARVRQLRIQVDCDGPRDAAWAVWLDAQLTPVKDTPKSNDVAVPNPHNLRADRVVVWNVYNSFHRDQGTRRINLLLFRGDQPVWQKTGIDIPWDGVSDTSVTVPIPGIAFNRVRAEITDIAGATGAGLAEIEVFRGEENIARSAVATASATWPEHSPVENFSAATINDGVTTSKEFGFGYTTLESRTNGWYELEWQPPEGKAHPLLSYPLKRHPTTAVSFDGHWYLYVPGNITWTEAQQRCQAMGGYLACIESPQENEFVHHLVKERRAWTGLQRQNDDTWAWINGAKSRFVNWEPGQPDNHSPGEPAGEIMTAGKWNDAPLGSPLNLGFVCEWEF